MSEFKFHIPMVVRFRDLDAMGHVNHVVYLTYLESARIAYYLNVVRGTSFKDLDFILAEVSCTYKSPAFFGETLLVFVRMTSIGKSSFVLEFEIREKETQRLVATARSVQVMYDYEKGQSKPIPEELRNKLEQFEDRKGGY